MLGSALGVSVQGTMYIFMALIEKLSLRLACAKIWTCVSACPWCNPTFC